MKFTLSWLKEYLDTDATLEQITEKLTAIGLEVESVNNFAETLRPFTVAEVVDAQPHPQADRLRVCKVFTGAETLEIVCGAPNARAGIKVPLARIGTTMPNGLIIKKTAIRGVESNGMLCSAAELGISEDSEGILELPIAATTGKPFASFIGLDDAVIEIAITPNRGDCLGVYGIARDLAAAGLGTLKPFEMPEMEGVAENPIQVKIEAKDACSWFVGVYIKQLTNKPSPIWLKRKLESIGKKSVSSLVDITNYLAYAFGRPAHVYDADKLNGSLLKVRYAQQGEKFKSLDNKEYTLTPEVLVVADEAGPVAVAGVIGGLESSCIFETRNVYVEIANFSADAVARSGRALQIDSDARYRFERTVDYNSSKFYKFASYHIVDICGGSLTKPAIAGNLEYKEKVIDFDIATIQDITGIKANEVTAGEIFKKLGFKVEGKRYTVPSWRNDISIGEDLAEEYARLVGYDKIPSTPLKKPIENIPAVNQGMKKIGLARRLLASKGLNEVVTFSFMDGNKAQKYLTAKEGVITVTNPISSDLNAMRPSIIPNMLDAIAKNQARSKGGFAFFEVGSVFYIDSYGLPAQRMEIAGAACGIKTGMSALMGEMPYDVFDAKMYALSIISQYIDTAKLNVDKNEVYNYYHPGRSGIYKLGQNIIAAFGEIHPTLAAQHGIKGAPCAFEIFIDKLPEPKPQSEYVKKDLVVSNLQSIERDFAFIVNTDKKAQDIITAVRKAEKSISDGFIEDVNIFDIFENKKLGTDKKSVAISVKIQPKNATWTDEQIEAASAAIVESVRIATGATLRDS